MPILLVISSLCNHPTPWFMFANKYDGLAQLSTWNKVRERTMTLLRFFIPVGYPQAHCSRIVGFIYNFSNAQLFHKLSWLFICTWIFLVSVTRRKYFKINVWKWSSDQRSISDLVWRRAPSRVLRQTFSWNVQTVCHSVGWSNKQVCYIYPSTYHPHKLLLLGMFQDFGASNPDILLTARRRRLWDKLLGVCPHFARQASMLASTQVCGKKRDWGFQGIYRGIVYRGWLGQER